MNCSQYLYSKISWMGYEKIGIFGNFCFDERGGFG